VDLVLFNSYVSWREGNPLQSPSSNQQHLPPKASRTPRDDARRYAEAPAGGPLTAGMGIPPNGGFLVRGISSKPVLFQVLGLL